MRKIFILILVCVFTMTIFSGCGAKEDNSSIDELTPASSVSLGDSQSGEMNNKTAYKLYFINEQGKLAPETRYIDNTEVTKGNDSLATALVKELISGPAKGSLLHASIPQDTKVHSNVTIKDGVAIVDLSKDFVDKHQGGKKNEQLTIYSIVNTLTEINDIKSVQFKIDGKVKKEFKGSYQLDAAFPRSAYLNAAQADEKDVIKLEDDSAVKGNADTNNDNKGNVEKNNNNKDNSNSPKDNNQQIKDNSKKDQKTNVDVETDSDPLE